MTKIEINNYLTREFPIIDQTANAVEKCEYLDRIGFTLSTRETTFSHNKFAKFFREHITVILTTSTKEFALYNIEQGIYELNCDHTISVLIKFIMNQCEDLWSLTHEKAAIEAIRRDILLFVDNFNDGKYINLKDGILELDTYELKPHSSDYYTTIKLPFAYSNNCTTPIFNKYLDDICCRDEQLKLLMQETGFTCADEMLYPENYRYLNDVLSYVAIGARSVENQQHRLTASGFDIPVGMKNPTGGDISVMMNSITAAQHSHTFIYRGWEVESQGNPLAHAILRGYVNKHGQSLPNYHYEDLIHLSETYEKSGLANPAVIIDTNHANSGKKWAEQPRIAKEVLHSCRVSADIRKLVKGLMIESYIEDGAQKPEECVYGKSITDPCLGWEKTEKLILDLADTL